MKKVIFISVLAVFTAFTFVSCAGKAEKAAETEEVAASVKVYVCPMHPEIGSDTMTVCSECGMDLVENPMLVTDSTKMDMPM